MIVSGITSINLPALEKRFQLSSKDLGLIAGSNDISAILLVSIVSFYGEFGNKIKWLGYGMVITGQFHWRMRYLRTGSINDQRVTLQGFISPKCTRAPVFSAPYHQNCSCRVMPTSSKRILKISGIILSVVSWLVRSIPDRAVRVQSLAGDIALCS